MVDKSSEINRFDEKTKEQWIEQGVTHYKAQRYKEALVACERAIQLDPTYARAYHGRGLAFFRLKYYGDALKSYEQACQLDPNNAKIHGDIGELFYILGNYGKACTSYKRAIQLNNKYESVYLARAQALVEEACRWQSRDMSVRPSQLLRRRRSSTRTTFTFVRCLLSCNLNGASNHPLEPLTSLFIRMINLQYGFILSTVLVQSAMNFKHYVGPCLLCVEGKKSEGECQIWDFE